MAITVPVIGTTGWGAPLNAALTALDTNKVEKSTAVLNVKDFGAVGNGVTDDVNAFQAAVNQALLTGGSIYVPAGTYLISARGIIPAIRTAPAPLRPGPTRPFGSWVQGPTRLLCWRDSSSPLVGSSPTVSPV